MYASRKGQHTVVLSPPQPRMLELVQILTASLLSRNQTGSVSLDAPWGTVTSFPSTVRVISACRADVDANVRRPRYVLHYEPRNRALELMEPTFAR